MPQIPAAIPTQAFELIRNRIAEILVDELPSQATFAGDPKLNATVYVERSIMFDLTELPAVNVSVNRNTYSEQTQRNTDGEHTFTIDVHTSAKSTSSVRGDSLAAFRLQKLLGVCRGILEDSRYKTLGFAPPFIESRKVTLIEYAQPTDGDGTSSVQGRITFVVRAPDRNGVVTPELIAGYDTQVKLGLTEKGYIFTGDNIPVPPIVGAEISVNGTFYIDAEAGDEVDIPVLNSEGDAVGTVTPSVGVEVPDATYTLVDTDVPANTLDSGSIASGAGATIVAPAATVTVNTAPFGTAPSGGALNVPVVSEDLTNAGTIVAGKVVIANTDVTINTVAVDSLQAEDTYALTVTRDSLPYTPTYNQGTRTVNVNSVPQTGGYVRNPDYLALPELTSANERVCMLVIVFENRLNRVTVKYPNLTASTDWGDGTAATVSNGAKQEHLYDYASIVGTVYQWPNSGENYKQCILSTTRVGGAIANADFSDSYATAPVNQGAFIVDAIISLPNATILYMTYNFGRQLHILERLRIVGLGAIPAGSGWIRLGYSRNLQSIELPPNKAGNWSGAFTTTGRCAVPDINWDAVLTCAQMFQNADIISHGYLIANSSGSLALYADGCENLVSFGYIDAPVATVANQMFYGCSVLQAVGDIDAPLLQNCTNMFNGCFVLGSVRFLDASAITATTNMFANCLSLYDLEMFGLTRGVNLTNSSMGNYGMGNFAASLGTASGAQTITVTGTPFGALLTALDATALAIRLVMTGKGYTVVN